MSDWISKTKIGFIGCGHISQSIIRGLLNSKIFGPEQIFASNRSPGKLKKFSEETKINVLKTNEEVVTQSQIIILGVKPIDLSIVLDEISQHVDSTQIIISLAAGVELDFLRKKMPSTHRVLRLIPNTPVSLNKGVMGIYAGGLESHVLEYVQDVFKNLGHIFIAQSEEQLNSLLVATSSGVGFVFEIMSHFQDWLQSHGISRDQSRKMVVQTFLGASEVALVNKDKTIDDLQHQVISKKGVTAAGLDSMRSFELDRLIRISLDQAQNRNEEISRSLG